VSTRLPSRPATAIISVPPPRSSRRLRRPSASEDRAPSNQRRPRRHAGTAPQREPQSRGSAWHLPACFRAILSARARRVKAVAMRRGRVRVEVNGSPQTSTSFQDQPAETAPGSTRYSGWSRQGKRTEHSLRARLESRQGARESRPRRVLLVQSSLGISRADANLVGATYIDLQNRFSLEPTSTRVEGRERWARVSRCPLRSSRSSLGAAGPVRPYADRHVGQCGDPDGR
jgi:hypothetical protein